jgi:hypothetical protein
MSYYISTVKIATDTEKGVKWNTERYLIDAVSVTDAEKQVHEDLGGTGIDFEVKSVSKANIVKVIE